MLLNHVITESVFFHCCNSDLFILLDTIIDKMCLHTLPNSGFVGFNNLHVGLFWKDWWLVTSDWLQVLEYFQWFRKGMVLLLYDSSNIPNVANHRRLHDDPLELIQLYDALETLGKVGLGREDKWLYINFWEYVLGLYCYYSCFWNFRSLSLVWFLSYGWHPEWVNIFKMLSKVLINTGYKIQILYTRIYTDEQQE